MDNGLCDSSGQCNCKANVDDTSLSCSQCQDGYWNLTEHNPDGCQGNNQYLLYLHYRMTLTV